MDLDLDLLDFVVKGIGIWDRTWGEPPDFSKEVGEGPEMGGRAYFWTGGERYQFLKVERTN